MREFVTQTAVIKRNAMVHINRSMKGTMLISALVAFFFPPSPPTSTPPMLCLLQRSSLRARWSGTLYTFPSDCESPRAHGESALIPTTDRRGKFLKNVRTFGSLERRGQLRREGCPL